MSDVTAEAAALKRWLFDAALPLWWEQGADRVRGGFHEAITLDGKPLQRPHRARVIARQAFSYCEAGRLGWHGPWREAQRHALDYFRKHFITAGATVVSVVDLNGKVADPRFDLYDQAFALLAYASGHITFGEAAGWRRQAVALRTTLEQIYAHPLGGFVEDRAGRLPQRSNPHMHLLEAALAWIAVDDDPAWRRMADATAALCLEKFIDPATAALGEFFASDWSAAPGIEGRISEPGHHYEWAFLLDRWARLTGRSAPEAVLRLIAFADSRGLDPDRGVAVKAVLAEGGVHDPVARLWAQAERIRAYLAQHRSDTEVAAAIKGLRRFLATPTEGVWFDQLGADDVFIREPARATSLYHIIGAVAELCPMRPAARNAGFEVHVATRIDRHGAAIEAAGFHLHPISWRRGSLDPRDLIRVVREVRKLYRKLKPDLAHHVALPAAVIGSLAATGLPVVCLNALTGLGTMFIDDRARVRVARAPVRLALRSLLNRSRAAVLVQNLDDRAVMERLGVDRDRIALIPGSGGDVGAMAPSPEPAGPITIAFVGRLVGSKGIRTLLVAHERLIQRGREVQLIIAVLPSHREGLPLSLLEAAACGRPLIATDVPGCRDIARADLNALVVPLEDAEALADAIERLALDPQLRRKFGKAGRELVEREFSSQRIGRDLIALYRRLL